MEIIRADDDVTAGFVINPNQTAQDKTLSLRARGLHQLIRSLPPGFRITADEIARDWCPEGRDAVRNAMAELVAANIVHRKKYQAERGRWKTRMVVYGKRTARTDETEATENPQVAPTTDFQASVQPPDSEPSKTPGRTDDGFPGVGQPGVGQPGVGKPGVIDNTQRKTQKISIEGGSDAAPQPTPPAPAEWAAALVAGLDFGKRRRPNRREAAELAALVEAARAGHGLSESEIRRHCRAALNDATKNAVVYLRGALHPDRLPVPTAAPVTTPDIVFFGSPSDAAAASKSIVEGVENSAYHEWRTAMDRKHPKKAKNGPVRPADGAAAQEPMAG